MNQPPPAPAPLDPPLHQPMVSFRARWILPMGDHPPTRHALRHHAYLVVQGNTIVQVADQPTGQVFDLGDRALVPGLINAHTHLDLSARPTPLPFAGNFGDWLTQVVMHRRESPVSVDQAVGQGISQLLEAGTAAVGDFDGSGRSLALLRQAGLAGLVSRELLGLSAQRFEPFWKSIIHELEKDNLENDDQYSKKFHRCQLGFAPHSPYGVSREIFQRVCQSTMAQHSPVAVHWLETQEEKELLRQGTGPLKNFLAKINAWPADRAWPASANPWLDFLLENNTSRRWLLIHANYLDDQDLKTLDQAYRQDQLAGVVYCPRTHDYFGHEQHPWPNVRALGIPVGLGTDSRLSNPDLSVYNEARWLLQQGVDAEVLWQLLTRDGAQCLGLENTMGQLTPGYWSAFTVIRPAQIADHDATMLENLLAPDANIDGLFLASRWAYACNEIKESCAMPLA